MIEKNRSWALAGPNTDEGRYPGFDNVWNALERAVEAVELGAPYVTLLVIDEGEDGKVDIHPLASIVPPIKAAEEASHE